MATNLNNVSPAPLLAYDQGLIWPHEMKNGDAATQQFWQEKIDALTRGGALLTVLRIDRSTLLPEESALFARKNVTVVNLPAPTDMVIDSAMSQGHADSWHVMRWLEAQGEGLTTLYAPDRGGIAYYAALMKAAGLAFKNTTFHILGVGPTLWQLDMQRALPGALAVLEADFMERESLRLADVCSGYTDAQTTWMQQHGWRMSGTMEPTASVASSMPLVSVVVTHFNRPHLLEQALRSLQSQTYSNIEILVVDGGSTLPEAKTFLTACETTLKNGRVIYDTDRYVGAARNLGATQAKGEFVFFLDDDNYLMREALATLVAVAQRTNAHIITSANRRFISDAEPDGSTKSMGAWVPLGGALARGAFDNVFGDASFLISRSLFLERGGFTEDVGIGGEDAEFLARCVLSGLSLFVVPRPLYWYRVRSVSMSTTTGGHASATHRHRVLRAYADAWGPDAATALSYAVDAYLNPKPAAFIHHVLRQCLHRHSILRQFYYKLRSLRWLSKRGSR